MKLTTNQWIIVIAVAAIAVWYFFLRKKDGKSESGYKISDGGTGVNIGGLSQVSVHVPRYHCDWTDPRTGVVTTYEGPCNRAKANMGWVTKFD